MPNFTRNQKILITGLVLGTAFAGLLGFAIYVSRPFLQGPEYNRHMVASILNIPKPPGSLRVLGSESTGFTDVMTTISIQIDPREFPSLLKGYAFEETRVKGTSHSLATTDHSFEAEVGPLFDVTTQYEVFYSPFGGASNPEEFKYGGFVRVYTDETRQHAVIDLYVE